MTAKTMHASEAALRATLTTLAERYEQCAKTLEADLPKELFVEADTGKQWAATVAHNHRTAAQDLREVLRTGLIPNGWMTAAEEERYGTPGEALAPGKRYRITDEHLQQAAAVYRRAEEKGEPPTQAVAAHFNVAHSTAAKWMGHARKRSLLRRWTVSDNVRSGLQHGTPERAS